MQRTHDLTIFGATGFVGRLIAAHLATDPGELRIALAGRSRDRLEALRRELAVDWPLVVADTAQPTTLAAMARDTTAVLSTVGPYTDSGMALVGACAEAGAHYCDLTGEAIFVADSIAAFDELARDTGAAIVHSCGFDSVPSDLSVHLARGLAGADGAGHPVGSVLTVTKLAGGFSGGTLASMRGQFAAAAADPERARLVGNEYALCPGTPPRRGEVLLESSNHGYTGPFVMGPYNRQLVHRSDQLASDGTVRLQHRERLATGRGPQGLVRAAGMIAALGAATVGFSTRALAPALDRVLPAPGDGPSPEQRERGRFRMETELTTSTGARYRSVAADDRDPGYDSTAVMIGEAGRLLATGRAERAGVLTPATALGDALVDRLRANGSTLTCERVG
ncbi:NAD(P)H-binding protein [Naumannella sp. ID2617S]|nr:NAD(P)H-binding protein [Naumannella sp. ID2617S]